MTLTFKEIRTVEVEGFYINGKMTHQYKYTGVYGSKTRKQYKVPSIEIDMDKLYVALGDNTTLVQLKELQKEITVLINSIEAKEIADKLEEA